MATMMTSSGGWFDQFEQLRREMDILMESSFGPTSIRAAARGAYPAVNVGIGPDSVDVYVFVPGIDSDKLDVSIDDHVLTVSGERPRSELPGGEASGNKAAGDKSPDQSAGDSSPGDKAPGDKARGRVYLRERFAGPFSRAITLPEEIDPDSSRAEYRNGVLHISFGRRQEARLRRIEVK
jgi:HSP20 family protein